MRHLLRISYEPHIDPATGEARYAHVRAEYSDGSVDFDTLSAAAYRDAMARADHHAPHDADPDHRPYRHPERDGPDR